MNDYVSPSAHNNEPERPIGMKSFALDTDGHSVIALNPALPAETLAVEELLVELFSEMRAPLHRHLLWLNLTPDQAEDIVQETFLRLFQHLSRPEFERRNLRGWVWRVAHNLGVNLRMDENRKENIRELSLGEVSDWLADAGPDPEQQLQRRQTEDLLTREMALLEDREKQCFHLRAQGLGYRQIASVLGIGRSTVADTMTRVTNALRRSYSHP